MRWLAITISLKVSAIFPPTPVQTPGKRTEKSPSRMVCRLTRIAPRSALLISALPRSPFPDGDLETFGRTDRTAVPFCSLRFMLALLANWYCVLHAHSERNLVESLRSHRAKRLLSERRQSRAKSRPADNS